MFEARLVQGHILKRLAEALKELVDEGNLCVSNDGITMNAMDKSHVCLIHMQLKTDMFEHYRCDRPMNMGVNMANFLKVLKCAGNEDIITMKADDDGDTLTLMFEATKKQDRVSEFELKLLSIDSETLGIPEQAYSACIHMPTHVYQDIFKDMSTIGETVHLAAIKGQLKFTTYGDVGSAVVMLRENTTADKPEEDVSIEVMEPVAMTFALRYLNNFAKASPLCSSVQIGLTRDLPVAVVYELTENKGTLKYFLAPKIDDEEDMEDAAEGETSKAA